MSRKSWGAEHSSNARSGAYVPGVAHALRSGAGQGQTTGNPCGPVSCQAPKHKCAHVSNQAPSPCLAHPLLTQTHAPRAGPHTPQFKAPSCSCTQLKLVHSGAPMELPLPQGTCRAHATSSVLVHTCIAAHCEHFAPDRGPLLVCATQPVGLVSVLL